MSHVGHEPHAQSRARFEHLKTRLTKFFIYRPVTVLLT